MNTAKQLEELFNIILAEIKENKTFAQKVQGILNNQESNKESVAVAVVKKRNRRNPAILNPMDFVDRGEEELRKVLLGLEVEQLKDIIAEYGMDPGRKTSKWRKIDRFVNHIIEMTISRSQPGDAFR